MKNIVPIVLISIPIFLFAACGSPPLVMPENVETASGSTAVSQSEQAIEIQSPLALPTATVEVVEEVARSPLAPPPATAVIKPTAVGATPTAIPVFITPIYSPTPAPSPTPTATFEPLSDKPIMGYVFGKRWELKGLDDSVIAEWVPDSVEEISVIGGDFLDAVNILTGEKQRLAEWNADVQFVTDNPVWLHSAKAIAMILGNLETKQYELWISTLGRETAKQANLTNVERSFIPIGTDTGLGVYDLASKTLMSITDDGTVLQTKATPLQVTPTTSRSLPYNVTQHGNWVAYYNRDNFLIVNLETNETKNIDFTDEQGHPLSAWDTQWSWDGNQLAVLLSQRDPTLLFKYLYVYDLASDKLKKIETPFTHFIDAVAWLPNNRHVIVNAVIGEAEYQTSHSGPLVSKANALFLVDIATMENSPIPIHSPDIASSIGQVLWSSNGKYLVARYRFFEGTIHTYRIDVELQ